MTTLKKFDEVIKDLKALKAPPPAILADKITPFNELITTLKELKNQVIGERIEAIKNLVSKDGSAIKISSFELMQHDFKENSHSNLLRYIFDYELLGTEASEILADFICGIQDIKNKETLAEKIKKRHYTLEREKRVDGGIIDLLIKDDTADNKFLIIIENKLFSSIIDKTEEDGIEKTQLDNYLNYAHRHPSHDKAFILLSYKIFDKKYLPFRNIDYHYLYNEIVKERLVEDDIFKDYKLLLHSLYSSTDKIYLKRALFKINHNKDITNINLSDIEDLKKELKWQKINSMD